MNKINIMFLYSAKGFGGIVRNLSLLLNGLDKEKFNVSVVSLANPGDSGSDIDINKDSGIDFYRLEEKGRFDLGAVKTVGRLLRDKNIDILSCHGYKADIYGFLLRKFYGAKAKLITMAHGWVTPGLKIGVYYTLDKIAMRFFDKIILVAPSLRKELSWFMVPNEKITIINNAIDPNALIVAEDRKIIRSRFGLMETDLVIGFIGRLSKEKDIVTTIRAVKDVSRIENNIKLLIAGEGPLKDELVRLSRKLGIGNRVIFTGYQKAAAPIYKAIDIYISAARKEGLPNSLLEAQAAGVPCIVTDIGGNNDIIKDGLNGFLFKPGKHRVLYEKIVTFLKDRNLAEKFSRESRDIITNKFSLPQRISKIEKIYMDLYKDQSFFKREA